MNHFSIHKQRGATLLISLIMLVILTLFALTSFNLSSINLKIVGNFQAQKYLESVVQQAIEQVISTPAAFSLTPAAQTVCVGGGTPPSCTGGYAVAVSAPACNYTSTAKGYTKKIGELTPEDTLWSFRATATDSATGAAVTMAQGVALRLLAGNCPVSAPGP